MFWLNSCHRCHGDLLGNFDNYGGFIYCLQCGHYLAEAEESKLTSAPPQGGTGASPMVVHIKIPSKIPA